MNVTRIIIRYEGHSEEEEFPPRETRKRNLTVNLDMKVILGNDGVEEVESNEANYALENIVFLKPLLYSSHCTALLYILFIDSSKIVSKGRRH